MYRFLIVIEKGKRNFSAYSETVASLQGIGSKPPVLRGNPPSKSAFSVPVLQSPNPLYFGSGVADYSQCGTWG